MKQLMISAMVAVAALFATRADVADSDAEFTVKRSKPVEVAEKPDAKSKPRKSPRKCWHCHGKGKILQTIRETCDRCDGAGVLVTEVQLRNKQWSGDYGKLKNSTSKRSCPRCNRTGTVSVKKEVECSYCKGTGELLK